MILQLAQFTHDILFRHRRAQLHRGLLLMMAGLVLFIIGASSVRADGPTPTPVPVPILSIAKVAVTPTAQIGELIGFTIRVSNTGNLDSGANEAGNVTVQDTLPFLRDVTWVLGASTFTDCQINNNVLTCYSTNIVRRHVNEAETDFVNGEASVDVWAIATVCGTYSNNAIMIYKGKVQSTGLRSISVPCPVTPTPATPTPVPPTPTATIPYPTEAPPIIIIREVTPVNTPRPPNTGSGEIVSAGVSPASSVNSPELWLGGAIIIAGLVVMASQYKRYRR